MCRSSNTEIRQFALRALRFLTDLPDLPLPKVLKSRAGALLDEAIALEAGLTNGTQSQAFQADGGTVGGVFALKALNQTWMESQKGKHRAHGTRVFFV